MRDLPSLRSLQIFETTARTGSLTAAAEELGLTQSAVSKQIAQLEALIGLPVFERQHRKVLLTEAGRRLQWIATTTRSDLSARLQSLRGGSEKTVNVVADADFAQLWLFPKLPEFQKLHPDITISIRSETRLSEPPGEAYDCALLWGRGDWRNCRFEPFLSNAVFPVCSPDIITGALKGAGLEQAVSALPIIHDRSTHWWTVFLASLGSDTNPEQGPVYNSTVLCLDAAARGDGITMGDEVSSRHLLDAGTLITLSDRRLPSPETYFFALPRSSEISPETELFRAWLFTKAGAHRSWYDAFWRSEKATAR